MVTDKQVRKLMKLINRVQDACNNSHSRTGKSDISFFRPKTTNKEHNEYDPLSTNASALFLVLWSLKLLYKESSFFQIPVFRSSLKLRFRNDLLRQPYGL
jgi:hypothetical protein